MADRAARVDRGRVERVDDGVLGCGHEDRIERAGIVGDGRRHDALDAEGGVSLRVAHRRIDAVDRRRRGAGIVDRDMIGVDGHRGMQVDRRVVAVDPHMALPGAARQLADRRHHAGAALVDDMAAELVEIVDAVLAHHVAEAPLADQVAADQRMDVALDLDRLADVGADDAHHALVHPAFAHQRQQRQEQAFVIDLPAVGRLPQPADIDHVRGAGEQRHQLAVVERRRGDDDVVEMAGALPRIVGDVGVARLHRFDRELADEMDDAARHRVHVPRRAGDGLGQHLAFEIEHAGRDVAGLARAGREGGAHQRPRLFLDDGEQAIPHHLQADVGQREALMSRPPGRSGRPH